MAKTTRRPEGTQDGDEKFVDKTFSLPMLGKLRVLWVDESLTQVQIQVKLGISNRNMVAGKAKQIGLHPRTRAKPAPKSFAMATAPVMVEIVEKPIPPQSKGPIQICCWPIGDTRTKTFRFCGEKFEFPSRSYCEDHHILAHQKK